VCSTSNYYNYTPSLIGKDTFFYPIAIGRFIYEPNYHQMRSSFDSFLLLYIQSGSLHFCIDAQSFTAEADSFVLIDCYRPHEYFTDNVCECLWLHFDGVVARSYYNLITEKMGNCFFSPDGFSAYSHIQKLYEIFENSMPIREAELSKLISDTLTVFLLHSSNQDSRNTSVFDEIRSYINEAYAKDITVELLAQMAHLSPYYFIRCFKKETGFTPHEYLLQTRIGAAKYMLLNTTLPVKDICFACGFSCESIFCTAFKKMVGMSPSQYRAKTV
jgi:AraC-like DNA-binding protein